MRRQIRELTKIFFGRFLENDLICLDGDTTATLTNILALLAAPGVILPVLEHFIYARFPGKPLYIWDLLSLGEKNFYVCYSMTILGIVIALEWDSLMPDRRDFMILRPFPVRLDFILVAKLAALAAFWGVFTLLVNGISCVMFPAVVVQDAGFARLIWFIRCHLLAILGGNAFMFLAVLALQGILMNVLGWRWYRRVSPYAQLVLIAGCLVMFLSLSPMSAALDPARPLQARLLWYPPAWFAGLYQHDLGWNQPVFAGLAAHAWRMLGITALIAAVSFALGYKRQVRRSLEVVESRPTAPGWMARALIAILHRVVLRSPRERAAFHFVCHTTLRSRRHRGLLAGWAAGGFALVFNSIAGVMATHTGVAWWQSRHGPLLAIPLVLSFFWLCGLRYIFTVPADLPANWLFRVSGTSDIHAYIGGVRKAVALLGILPLFGLLAPLYIAVWGWSAGLVHIVFGVVIAILLMDGLLTGFAKVPFTCSYVPGKANVKSLWALYLFAFVMYVSLFSGLDFLVLEEPSRILALFVFAALCETGLYLYRRRIPAEEWQIVFDERAAPAVQTLDLGA